MQRIRTIILGAAGRDFHNFNVIFRDDARYEVCAFTAQQIPHIADRRYPPELAGSLYPQGIPIHPEEQLERLIAELGVDSCVLAYSDLAHVDVMHLASRANAAGAEFRMLGAQQTMLTSELPVVSICASRTGAGKSQTTRAVVAALREEGLRMAVLRHPMPYGDLLQQRVQRFAVAADLDRARVTIEEREEYEPHIAAGSVVWAGVDYAAILADAQREADVVVWDGGNNDTSFLKSDLYITVVDPHRPGHERLYHPGETNVRMADIIVINKVDTADPDAVRQVRANVQALNPRARMVEAESPIEVDDPALLSGRRVIAVEDGPTLTHGGMPYGAATIAARRSHARLMDARPFAAGELADTFHAFPHIDGALPAMGYGETQIRDLEATLQRAAKGGAEAIVVGTPVDLAALIDMPLPYTRVRYAMKLRGPTMHALLAPILERAATFHDVDQEC
jgi:predicted GTPase